MESDIQFIQLFDSIAGPKAKKNFNNREICFWESIEIKIDDANLIFGSALCCDTVYIIDIVYDTSFADEGIGLSISDCDLLSDKRLLFCLGSSALQEIGGSLLVKFKFIIKKLKTFSIHDKIIVL